MNTAQKGEIAQLHAELRAVELGHIVSRPLTVSRYDLLIDNGSKIFRVQVKYADGKASGTDNAVLASLTYTDRSKQSNYYSEEDVDAFVIYVPRVDEVLWFPAHLACGKGKLQIKVSGKVQSNSIWYKDWIWK